MVPTLLGLKDTALYGSYRGQNAWLICEYMHAVSSPVLEVLFFIKDLSLTCNEPYTKTVRLLYVSAGYFVLSRLAQWLLDCVRITHKLPIIMTFYFWVFWERTVAKNPARIISPKS